MTPSMGMAAPKGMAAAPQAGLAALAQPAQAPKGMSSNNMAQVMSMARKMSDAQLADVLQGKSLDVPQYVAMTEAMGRKSLRTAMQGQQAMAQAQQPSVKQKLLMGDQPQMPAVDTMGNVTGYAGGGSIDMNESANAGGLAELPAPNMQYLTLASGGIIAFDEGGEIPRYDDGGLTEEQVQQMLTRGSIRRKDEDLPENPLKGFGSSQRSRPYLDAQKNAMREAIAAAPKVTTEQAMQQDMENAAPGKVMAVAPAGGPTKEQIDALNARPRAPVVPGAPNEKAGLGATDEFKSYMDTVKKNNADYLSKLEGMGAKQREGLAAIRSQGGGEALMNLAQGILSKPGLAAGVAAGLPGVTATAAASRKEQRAIEQSANDYDLNVAKAQEAAAKGDMESALMFKKMAQDAKYQQGMLAYHNAALNKPGESMQLLNALGDPEMMKRYKEMQVSKKGELYSIDKATDDFNGIMKDQYSAQAKQLKALGITKPYQYQQYVLNQGGGGGIDLASQAAAELARRSKS